MYAVAHRSLSIALFLRSWESTILFALRSVFAVEPITVIMLFKDGSSHSLCFFFVWHKRVAHVTDRMEGIREANNGNIKLTTNPNETG